MATIKMNVTVEPRIAELAKSRALEQSKPVSRYLADLVEADARRAKDVLAAEGYRLLAVEAEEFSEAALAVGEKSWPEWEQ